jgi:hypothetical protein
MSKEINRDHRRFFGTAVDDHCSVHSGRPTATGNSRRVFRAVLMASICACASVAHSQSAGSSSVPGEAGEPYPNMPRLRQLG